MLGKVIRYEFKSTARLFLLMYAALIVMALINMVVMPWNGGSSSANVLGIEAVTDVLNGLLMLLYVTLAIATAVVTMVIIVSRFYRLLGDEGYLWFTLPVTTNQHILAKLITGVVWSIASFAAIVLSLFVLFARLYYLDDIAQIWQQITSLGVGVTGWIIAIVVALLVSAVSSILVFYASISLGPHITKNRLGGSVIAYIIAYIITQIISTVTMFVGFHAMGNLNFEQYAGSNIELGGPSGDNIISSSIDMVNQIGGITLAIVLVSSALLGVAGYIITNRMLTKKLNLG